MMYSENNKHPGLMDVRLVGIVFCWLLHASAIFAGTVSFEAPYRVDYYGVKDPGLHDLSRRIVKVMDMNNDGHNDITMLSCYLGNNPYCTIIYYENDGLSHPSFTRYDLNVSKKYFFNYDLGDVNGDGFADLVAGSNSGISLFLNNKKPHPSFVETSISTSPCGQVHITDMDGDKVQDILLGIVIVGTIESPSFLSVAWLKNDGKTTPHFTLQGNMGSKGAGPASSHVDFNNDGRKDLLTIYSYAVGMLVHFRLCWYQRIGGETPLFIEHKISDDVFADASAVTFENNGRADLFSTNGTMKWMSNNGGSTPTFTLRNLDGPTDLESPFSIFRSKPFDMNHNGKLDLMTVLSHAPSYAKKAMVFYENNGAHPPVFKPWTLYKISHSDLKDFTAGDLDGDGDLDVVEVYADELLVRKNKLLRRNGVSQEKWRNYE